MSPQKVPLWHVDYLELEDNWASKVSGGAFYSSELHSDSVMHICVCVCVYFSDLDVFSRILNKAILF